MQPMRVPDVVVKVAHVVLVLGIPVLLLVSPLYLFASPAYIRHEYGLPGFPPSIRFNPAERLRLSETIVRYVAGRESQEAMATARTDAGEVALRPEEAQHLIDVRVVMDGFRLVHGVVLGLAVLSAVGLWFSGQRVRLSGALAQGVWVTAGLIAAIVLFSLIDFDLFFTRFHQMFFTEGTWVFYLDDTLIQLYPLPLWMDAVWKIGVMVAAEMAALYGLSLLLRRQAG